MPVKSDKTVSKDDIIKQLSVRIAELEKQQSEESLLRFISNNSKDIVSLIQQYLKNHIHLNVIGIKFSIWMTVIAAFIILTIIGVSAYLTLHGKIDGSTFTFLLGLIVGYVLTFIRQSINPEDN